MADPRHPANDAWEAMLSAHASLMRRFSAEDVWEDISMKEYDVLYTLSKCPEPIRITDLNQHVLLSQPALSRMVDRLADRGLIGREPDPADGRSSPAGASTRKTSVSPRSAPSGKGPELRRGTRALRARRPRDHPLPADLPG